MVELKIAIFDTLYMHSAPPLEGSRRIIGVEKLEWCGYPMVKKRLICIAVSTQYRRVTGKRTGRRTS